MRLTQWTDFTAGTDVLRGLLGRRFVTIARKWLGAYGIYARSPA